MGTTGNNPNEYRQNAHMTGVDAYDCNSQELIENVNTYLSEKNPAMRMILRDILERQAAVYREAGIRGPKIYYDIGVL